MFKGARAAGAADAGPDGQLAELFARLQTAVDDQAHKKALKISESILEASPGDADATRCKVVALLELARYADAVACVSAAEPSLRADLAFEHAYALYKSHHLSDALALLEATSGGDDGPSFAATQLKAQLLYRDGRARERRDLRETLRGASTVRATALRAHRSDRPIDDASIHPPSRLASLLPAPIRSRRRRRVPHARPRRAAHPSTETVVDLSPAPHSPTSLPVHLSTLTLPPHPPLGLCDRIIPTRLPSFRPCRRTWRRRTSPPGARPSSPRPWRVSASPPPPPSSSSSTWRAV